MGIISQWRSFAWEHPAKALLLTIIPFVPLMLLGSVVIFTVIPAKAGIQRPLAANAYLPATGFRVPAFAGMTETDAWRPIFLN